MANSKTAEERQISEPSENRTLPRNWRSVVDYTRAIQQNPERRLDMKEAEKMALSFLQDNTAPRKQEGEVDWPNLFNNLAPYVSVGWEGFLRRALLTAGVERGKIPGIISDLEQHQGIQEQCRRGLTVWYQRSAGRPARLSELRQAIHENFKEMEKLNG